MSMPLKPSRPWQAVAGLAALFTLGAHSVQADDFEALRVGDMRGLMFHAEPMPVTDETFTHIDGGEFTLAEFEGQVILLNFWATWCAPCREEMPSLDALNEELGGDDFQVVTLAMGRNPVPAIERFFEEEGIETLPTYLDPQQAIGRNMSVFGLPITVVLNSEGQEIARYRGDADWASEEAVELLRAVIEADASS